MRGKGTAVYSVYDLYRITPAYAGKSTVGTKSVTDVEDHPRLCGEKLVQLVLLFDQMGSPPPMRGKAEALAVADLLVGITPAYAGKRNLTI